MSGQSYDETLLASAPAATKAQLQEGYTTDLLHSSAGNSTPPPFSTSQADVERGLASKEYNDADTRPISFWRTTKGIIIIVVAIIVVLAAVIGGAVGGSVGKHKNNDSSTVGIGGGTSQSQGQSQGSPGNGGGIGGSATTTVSGSSSNTFQLTIPTQLPTAISQSTVTAASSPTSTSDGIGGAEASPTSRSQGSPGDILWIGLVHA